MRFESRARFLLRVKYSEGYSDNSRLRLASQENLAGGMWWLLMIARMQQPDYSTMRVVVLLPVIIHTIIYIVDCFQVSNINDISGDIQSIYVLKDASFPTPSMELKVRTALFFVTTKSGKGKQKSRVFNAHWGVSNVSNLTGYFQFI